MELGEHPSSEIEVMGPSTSVMVKYMHIQTTARLLDLSVHSPHFITIEKYRLFIIILPIFMILSIYNRTEAVETSIPRVRRHALITPIKSANRLTDH